MISQICAYKLLLNKDVAFLGAIGRQSAETRVKFEQLRHWSVVVGGARLLHMRMRRNRNQLAERAGLGSLVKSRLQNLNSGEIKNEQETKKTKKQVKGRCQVRLTEPPGTLRPRMM